MENITFLTSIFIFLAFLCSAILVSTIGNKSKLAVCIINIVASSIFVFFLAQNDSHILDDTFYLSAKQTRFLIIIGILNILISILNGTGYIRNIWSSLISSFIFFGGICLLSAREFITFFIAFELITLMEHVLVGLSTQNSSREVAIKNFIQGAIISALFLLGIVFFYGATGSFEISSNIVIKNQQFFEISLILMFVVTCYKLGVFPFHVWMSDLYANTDKGNVSSMLLLIRPVMAYIMITLVQMLLVKSELEFQQYFIKMVLVISIISALYGNIIGIMQRNYKKVVSYLLMANSGYLLIVVLLGKGMGHENHLVIYLIFHSIAACGSILLLNDFENNTKNKLEVLAGGFYKSGFHAIKLTVFILSLAGFPLTSGFMIKYLLFADYFCEGYVFEAILLLVSSIIGFICCIRFLVALFMERPNNQDDNQLINTNWNADFVQIVFVVIIIIGGIIPTFLVKY